MSPTATAAPESLPQLTVQGIAVPRGVIDPSSFYRGTRKQRFQLGSPVASFAGFGNTDSIEARKAGILAAIDIKFTGSLVVTPSTGSVATTSKWPLDLPKRVKLSINGGSYVINCSGWKLRARHLMSLPGLTDRGVPQGITGASPGTTKTQGTLALASDSWGVGSQVTGIAAGTYDVEIVWRVPVSWDLVKLFGALFLQTSATSVEISIDWSPLADLFTVVAPATVALTGGWYAEGIVFDIPQSGGVAVLPDLSVYHTLLQTNTGNVSETANEVTLAGQGAGKSLQRVFGQIFSGATSPGVPMAMNNSNYGQLGWMYSGNQQPESWTDGSTMRADLEESYGSDLGGLAGFFCFDFAKYWSFRDSVNEGDATELRMLLTVASALTSPRLEYAQETIVAGALS